MNAHDHHLILGGARSGKSAYAEKLAHESSLEVVYIATAQVYDNEFGHRVSQHQQRRPAHWQTVEVPHKLAEALQQQAAPGRCLLVDCLTLWLAQCICPDCAPPEGVDWQRERTALLDALPSLPGKILLVSNEVGMGIVPLGEINRQFQDEAGRLNQAVASLCNKVSFIAAGLPLALKA
ncbi:bifunctional adenosylcobinamide kinase/adenosylcobinamide-phosphate guanylyltransferase [Methylobacillus flagellatus]|uniref:bifunctional adenosylcobinamide kinase/adenosylcobinamide-phosphate guanylyltransferase n=1 Tax=Methylobacillus flagellatus TaxID=405 RepID=UPI0028538B35|nr:bifunctional adenosylcobinamide kinase/adenosylcobinamide-phosphate guanylyltransferase [Methylobacillus flagellatus]MDR5172963.1 bifunctional adenosylcobinamide kinase/adenosylcobinamide-phosphate guanylyltransferase [Methylobacillus flagellatus]